MTGGYGGFSRLLLDATKEAFDYVGGAEPSDNLTSALLLEQRWTQARSSRMKPSFIWSHRKPARGGGVSQFIPGGNQKTSEEGGPKGQGRSATPERLLRYQSV